MSNPVPSARLTGGSLLHRLRRVPVPLASTLSIIEAVMYDNDIDEISITALLDLPEIQWYGNPHKTITHMAKHGFLEVTRKEYSTKFRRGYRYFRLTPRGLQVAEDYNELQQCTAVARHRRVLEWSKQHG